MANNMSVIIRENGQKHNIPTQDDIVLEDLIEQLISRQTLHNGNYMVSREGMSDGLNQARTLSELSISDGDILDLSSVGNAG